MGAEGFAPGTGLPQRREAAGPPTPVENLCYEEGPRPGQETKLLPYGSMANGLGRRQTATAPLRQNGNGRRACGDMRALQNGNGPAGIGMVSAGRRWPGQELRAHSCAPLRTANGQVTDRASVLSATADLRAARAPLRQNGNGRRACGDMRALQNGNGPAGIGAVNAGRRRPGQEPRAHSWTALRTETAGAHVETCAAYRTATAGGQAIHATGG